MNATRNENLAKEHIIKARAYGRVGKHGSALSHYIQCIYLFPEKKPLLEADFTRTLMKWGIEMYEKQLIPQLLQIYEKSLKIYPTSSKILNDLGTHVFHLGYHKNACGIFSNAQKLDPSYASAERNLNHVKNLLVERWHFRMLNDIQRNKCYRDAIADVIGRDEIVLDVGTGSGLLTLFAGENSPTKLIACEESETMFEIATNVFRSHCKTKNGGNEDGIINVNVINKSSNILTVDDIGEKATLLITEIFDAAVFGEGILQTLMHANENLLVEGSKVLPKRAIIYACAIESTCIASKKILLKREKQILNLNKINAYSIMDEPYDTENLRIINDVRYLTNAEEVLKVDFDNIIDIKAYYKGDKIGELTGLTAVQNGRVDAIAVWFTLYLTDDIFISTDPRLSVTVPAWDQAIFPINSHIYLNKGTSLSVQFTCRGGMLRMLLPTFTNEKSFVISDLMVRFLNDSIYLNEICDAVSALSIYLQQLSDVHVLDLSPVPVLGFLLMQRGAQHLSCVVENGHERKLFKEIARQNNIDLTKLHILKSKEFEYGYCDRKYHVIMNHLFEVCGEASRVDMELSQRLSLRSLAPGGVMLPYKVGMDCKLLYSPWLNYTNKVVDFNVFHYDIPDYMNVYQVTQNICINENTLNPVSVQNPITLLENCSLPDQEKIIEVRQEQEGKVNAALCYFKIQLLENGGYVYTNRCDSFMDSIIYRPLEDINVSCGDIVNILLFADDDGTINVKLQKD